MYGEALFSKSCSELHLGFINPWMVYGSVGADTVNPNTGWWNEKQGKDNPVWDVLGQLCKYHAHSQNLTQDHSVSTSMVTAARDNWPRICHPSNTGKGSLCWSRMPRPQGPCKHSSYLDKSCKCCIWEGKSQIFAQRKTKWSWVIALSRNLSIYAYYSHQRLWLALGCTVFYF